MSYTTGNKKREGGQAVVLVTLGLIAMCGMMSLAVDIGWAYFVRQAEQTAADALALAVARQTVSKGCPWTSSDCSAPSDVATLETSYATNNLKGISGLTVGTPTVVTSAAPPGLSLKLCSATALVAPCVWSYVSETITAKVPQLFAAVMGHPYATVGVTSIAVVSSEVINGSLVLTNRSLDTVPSSLSSILPQGSNLSVGYCSDPFFGICPTLAFGLQANMGIVMSSICGGSNCTSGAYAGDINPGISFFGIPIGGGLVAAPFTQILGTNEQGWVNQPSNWSAAPINLASGNQFNDPFTGVSQPPVQSAATSTCTATTTICTNGGALPPTAITGSSSGASPTIIPPGGYWVANSGCTTTGKSPKCTATGAPMTLGSGYFEFVDSSAVGTFSTYIFYGGLSISANTHVTFGPGMYIFAGSNQMCSGGAPCPEISIAPGAQICDGPLNNPFCGQTWNAAASNAGEIFVFTGANSNGGALTYPGLPTIPSYVSTCSCLTYGQAGFSFTGNGATAIDLHGLNASNSNLPSGTGTSLQPYAPIIMWQDQANSYIKYNTASPYGVDTTCGSLNLPCTNTPLNALAPQMNLTTGFEDLFFTRASGHFSGTVYQPRGAWISLGVDGSILSPDPVPLQIISGAAIVEPATVSLASPLILENMTNPPPATHIGTALVQ